jgi:hypothetical protein
VRPEGCLSNVRMLGARNGIGERGTAFWERRDGVWKSLGEGIESGEGTFKTC